MDTELTWRGVEYTSDPVITLDVGGGETRTTSVKKNSLAPVWLETFDLAIHHTEADTGSLRILVEDWDLVSGNDFMGRGEVRLSKMRDKHRERRWVPLHGAPREGSETAADGRRMFSSMFGKSRKGAKGAGDASPATGREARPAAARPPRAARRRRRGRGRYAARSRS